MHRMENCCTEDLIQLPFCVWLDADLKLCNINQGLIYLLHSIIYEIYSTY